MRKQDGARVVRAAVAMGLAGTLAMPGAAWAADGSAGALSAEKDEVVYVKAGADGAPGSLPATTSSSSAWLRTPKGSTANRPIHQTTK